MSRSLDLKVIVICVSGLFILLTSFLSREFSISEGRAFFSSLSIVSAGVFVFMWIQLKHTENAKGEGDVLLGEFSDKSWWQSPQHFYLQTLKTRHVLITGGTGSGKSTVIRRSISEGLKKGYGFCCFDIKGERKEYEELLKLVKLHGAEEELQVFDLGNPKSCLCFNPLIVFDSVEETVAYVMDFFGLDHPFYKAEAEQFVRQSLHLFDAAKIKRSFLNLYNLLLKDRFRARAISKVPEIKREDAFFTYFEGRFNKLKDKERSERFAGLESALSGFVSGPLKEIFNGEGKQFDLRNLFEKEIPSIIRVPGDAYGDISTRIVQAFVSALPVLMAKRRNELDAKKYFIYLDEQCSYTSDTIIHLLKTAGSSNISVWLTRQCDGDFDSHGIGHGEKISAAIDVLIILKTLPAATRDNISKQIGTVENRKHTSRISQGQYTGESSERKVQEFILPPNDMTKYKAGEGHVSARTNAQHFDRKVKFYQPDLKEAA